MSFTILHTESSTGWGGQENRTLQECIGLKKRGARPIILCQPESKLNKRALAEGIEVRTCRLKKSYDLFTINYILRLIKKENINIISTHSGRDSLLAGIAGRLSRKKPKIVRTRHLALPITSKFTYNTLAHKIVTVSEYVKQYLAGYGVVSEKIAAIPTGIDADKFNPAKINGNLRQELGMQKDVPLIGTVAILRRKKGHHIILDAIPEVIKEAPEVVFVFAGDGPQKDNVLNKIKASGLSEKVFMLGLRKDIPEILKSLDIFVLPTLQEALGTSFIEAMAMAKPVIGSDVGGVGEVIKDSINGYLIEPDNSPALAEAIIKMLKNRETAELMGMEGRKIVERNYTIEKMCDRMYELYLSLIKERSQ